MFLSTLRKSLVALTLVLLAGCGADPGAYACDDYGCPAPDGDTQGTGGASSSTGGTASTTGGTTSTTGGTTSTTGGTTSTTGGTASTTGGTSSGGSSGGGSVNLTGKELHVVGRDVYDANGEKVVFRGIEHVSRWPNGYGVDEGGNMIGPIGRTGANALRMLWTHPHELETILRKAVVDSKMWVSIAHTAFDDPTAIATIQKYRGYVTVHAQGEVDHRDATKWRNDSIAIVKKFRNLGYTVPLEILSNGYGQTLDTILNEGRAVFDADPLKNVVFGVQMYSEIVKDIPGALSKIEAFPHPIWVGTCLFQEGIDGNWGNDSTTYQKVWDQTGARNITSFYWIWWGDNKNHLSQDGSFGNWTSVGRYIVNDSPYALTKASKKSAFLLSATAP
jgi:hypothetical protein